MVVNFDELFKMEIREKKGLVAHAWSGVSFRGTLRWFVAQIEYSHHRKEPRKYTPNLRFGFPKSSFGRHKMEVDEFDEMFAPMGEIREKRG